MLTRAAFQEMAKTLLIWCDRPAVQYKVLFHLLDVPYAAPELAVLRPAYLRSDIVEQLCREQKADGSWGPLRDKDYAKKAVFPSTFVALERCLYIGLTVEDRDMLYLVLEYLEDALEGRPRKPLYNKNERAVPWQMWEIAQWAERIRPNHPLCDRLWAEWSYIAGRAFADGTYSEEQNRLAQHEVFGTREKRLVPMALGLLLTRPEDLPDGLEQNLLDHYGARAYDQGYFWDKHLRTLPETFRDPKTRRYFHTIRYINRFHNTRPYLERAVDWLLESRGADGLWDYGPQTNDPWGYFGNFSLERTYAKNRVTDCTLEVLSVLKTYLDNNGIQA